MGLEPTTTGITILFYTDLMVLHGVDIITANQQFSEIQARHVLIEIPKNSRNRLTSALTYLRM